MKILTFIFIEFKKCYVLNLKLEKNSGIKRFFLDNLFEFRILKKNR